MSTVFLAKWIKHNGTKYHPDLIICTKVGSEILLFCNNSIVVKDDIVLLCGKLMETLYFDAHCHAFRVRLHLDMVLNVLNINELLVQTI